MWNPEKYLKILMYRATTGPSKITFSNGEYSVWYFPVLTYQKLQESNVFQPGHHVAIKWDPLQNGSPIEIDSPPNLLESITSAFKHNGDKSVQIKPILVSKPLEPSNIDEVFYTDDPNDLPKLCCTAFLFVPDYTNVEKYTYTNDYVEIAKDIDSKLRVIDQFGSLSIGQKQGISTGFITELKNNFMLTDTERQRKIIEALPTLFSLAEPSTSSPRTGQRPSKQRASKASPVPIQGYGLMSGAI